MPWPYPDNNVEEWRTYAVVVPITDLVHGTNVVQLGADQAEALENVDIILSGTFRRAVPILPGSNNKYPGTEQCHSQSTIFSPPPRLPLQLR